MARVQHTCTGCVPIDASIIDVYVTLVNTNEYITNAETDRAAAEDARETAETERASLFATDHGRAVADHSIADSDHQTASADHASTVAVIAEANAAAAIANAKAELVQARLDTADADHTRAEGDHGTAVSDHSTASTDHTMAQSDHETAGNDHTRAESDHSIAASDHTASASATAAATGAAELANTKAGLVQEKLDRADTDHDRAESDHTIATSDHTAATADHAQASADHTQAGTDHGTAAADHTTATSDHTQAGQDHTLAAADHVTAGEDHEQAQDDHEVLSGYDTRLGNVEGEVSQLRQEVDEKFHAPNTEVGGLDTGYYNTYASTLPTIRNTKNDCKSAKFSVTPGDKLKLYGEAGGNDYYRFYAFYDANGNRIDRYSSSGTYRDTPLDVTVPENAVTMVVNLVNYASATDKVIIPGEEYSLQDFDQRIEQTSEDVAGLSEDVSAVETMTEELESSIIEGASVSLKGLSSSNLVLNEAIELAQDGDELEIEVKDIGSVDYKGYPFSSSGVQSNSFYAIMLSQTKYGIRATDGTWLCQAVSVPHYSVNHSVKIVFDDGKVYSYVDGNLVHTYNGQKTIRVASFGNGGNGTYGYWTGTIVSIKHNGEYIDLYKQVNNDTILTFQYNFVRWEDMAGLDVLPIGILKYDSINHIFDYFSRYGKTDKYFSFRVRLNEDNTDPVYLKEWRLSEGKVWRYEDGNFTEIAKTIYDAENEMAMHLAGTADYTGGIHGDERIDVSPLSFVRFYADGRLITSEDMQEDFEIECASFCYMQLSTLHQTSETSGEFVTGHPIIAYHYKRNTFEDCASKLENVIKFASEQSVTQYHAGMMCVGKGVGLYAILPGMVETPELSGTNSYYDADDKSASRVDLWNPTTGFRCYVTGDVLQGFDNATELNQFQIWDRTTDSKYYRRFVRSADYAKVFVTNSFIRNEQTIKFY